MIRLLLISLFLIGCASLQTSMTERNPVGTFTTNLNAKELVDCMNTNQPPKPPLAIAKVTLIWLAPTKFIDGSDVIYFAKDPNGMSFILENGIAEMYVIGGIEEPRLKFWRDHYSSVCG